ncbi:MAG: cupin domain-containing protein [Planctomycetales bacterium]|nr:cupin domain-containing protein [Planctomycetales bacterium]
MAAEPHGERHQIVRLSEIAPVDCPCGKSRRAFVDDLEQVASLHLVEISVDARAHYHKRMTEIYFVLEGAGEIELDGLRQSIRPGDAILIKPGCRHRAIGKLKLLNTAIPAFDPADEWFD